MRLPFEGQYPITQNFGERPDYYKKYNLKGHNGMDYGLPTGTKVVAPHAGVVKEATFDPGYGYYVKIESDTEGSVLAHLKSISVRVGFSIAEGAEIGISNNTGDSSGPHLHWGYYILPRDRTNGYNGYIDQAQYLHTSYEYEYGIGDRLEPSIDIPVGKAPGTESFDYGKIGPKYPAQIVDLFGGYYNIDQRGIGGGTGWVKASDVDNTPVYVEKKEESVVEGAPSTPEPVKQPVVENTSYTQSEINEIVKSNKELRQNLTDLKVSYSGFEAIGFSSPEDVTKLIDQKNGTIEGLNKQILQVLKRNQELSKIVEAKEAEDATAIEEGIKAIEELNELKNGITLIAKKTDTKPTVFDILERFEQFKSQAEKAVEKTKKELHIDTKDASKKTGTGIQWLLNIFGWGGGESS